MFPVFSVLFIDQCLVCPNSSLSCETRFSECVQRKPVTYNFYTQRCFYEGVCEICLNSVRVKDKERKSIRSIV